jgi:Leucine-rich repeat (LRR) protein
MIFKMNYNLVLSLTDYGIPLRLIRQLSQEYRNVFINKPVIIYSEHAARIFSRALKVDWRISASAVSFLSHVRELTINKINVTAAAQFKHLRRLQVDMLEGIKNIKHLAHLRSLTIHVSQITDQDVAKLRNLRELRVYSSDLDGSFLVHTPRLVKLTAKISAYNDLSDATELRSYNSLGVTRDKIKFPPHLRKFVATSKDIERFDMPETLNELHVDSLMKLPKRLQDIKLDLFVCRTWLSTDAPDLSILRNVRCIDIYTDKYEDPTYLHKIIHAVVNDERDIKYYSGARTLDIVGDITNSNIFYNLPFLTKLTIRSSNISHDALMNLSQLTELHIDNTNFTDDMLDYLPNLLSLTVEGESLLSPNFVMHTPYLHYIDIDNITLGEEYDSEYLKYIEDEKIAGIANI